MPTFVMVLLVVAPVLTIYCVIGSPGLPRPVAETVEAGLVAIGVLLVLWVALDFVQELMRTWRRLMSRP